MSLTIDLITEALYQAKVEYIMCWDHSPYLYLDKALRFYLSVINDVGYSTDSRLLGLSMWNVSDKPTEAQNSLMSVSRELHIARSVLQECLKYIESISNESKSNDFLIEKLKILYPNCLSLEDYETFTELIERNKIK